MKKGISIWAFPDLPLKECFRLARSWGYEGVEVALAENGEINLTSTRDDLRRIRDEAQQCGIALYSLASGLYWTYSLTSPDIKISNKAEELARKQLEAAAWLGCETILVIPGTVNQSVPYEADRARSLDAITRLSKYAEQLDVTIGIENVWNKALLSPLDMRTFIDSVNSPRVGCYFDVGNVMRDGYPEQWISILGKRIAKVHFKDYKRSIGTIDGFVDLLSGDVNYPAVMNALKNIGYDGWVTAEVFAHSADYPEAIIQTSSCAMDWILGISTQKG